MKDFSNKNLQMASFRLMDLAYSRFDHCDLRGAKFSGANLEGADFTGARMGITPSFTLLLLLCALSVSVLSGYVAMLAGHTLQLMLHSGDQLVRNTGIFTVVVIGLFIAFSIWKGVGRAIVTLVLPAITVGVSIGLIALMTGFGTGLGALYLTMSLLLTVVMFVIGTISRVIAGSLSNILFLVVAMSGAFFGRSVGGGIGTVVMALSCMIISKRALKGAAGFEVLQRIARFITTRFGTSFRNARLEDAIFWKAGLRNCDFRGAQLENVEWGDAQKVNCIFDHEQEKLIV